MKVKYGILSVLVFIGAGLCAVPARRHHAQWKVQINNETDNNYAVKFSCEVCPAYRGRATLKARQSKKFSVPVDSNPYTLNLGSYEWTIEDMRENSTFRIVPHGVKMIRLLQITDPDTEPINLGDRMLLPNQR